MRVPSQVYRKQVHHQHYVAGTSTPLCRRIRQYNGVDVLVKDGQ